MLHSKIFRGKWFLPNKEGESVFGTLSFEPNKRIRLNLDFPLELSRINNEQNSIYFIHGVSNDGRMITLYSVYTIQYTPIINDEGKGCVGVSIVGARYIFIGDHLLSNFEFDRIRIGLENLNEWLSVFGFTNINTTMENSRACISANYRMPDDIEFFINESLTGKFIFSTNLPSNKYTNRLLIEQKSHLLLSLKKTISFEEAFDNATTFQSFLTLGAFEPASPIFFKFGNSNQLDDFTEKFHEFELLFSSRVVLKDPSGKIWHDFLFSYPNIKESFQKIISKWYEQHCKIEPIINILVENFYRGDQFNENDFLNMSQALETFHRRFREVSKMDKVEHKKIVDDIISAAPISHKGWLETKLRFGYEPTLDERLTELIEGIPEKILSAFILDRTKFKQQFKQSRNYYTHYPENLIKKAAKGGELLYLTQRIKLILIILILQETGFTNEELETLFENNISKFFQMILVPKDLKSKRAKCLKV